jgi:hypothetical protein
MNDIYCTYFDHNYLSRAMLTIESLRRFDTKTPIHILALSKLCETILAELALPNVEIIPLATLEEAYPELAAIKPTRRLIEYYFTLSPFLPHYLFSKTDADRVTYIDGDLYFFTSPTPIRDALGEASVAITPHRFSFEYRNHVQYGLFNVAWITYRRCAEGLDCLNTYKSECLAWCYDRVEGSRFGDQKYLDAWPDRYPSLKIIEHKGFNLAIWNVSNYILRMKNDVLRIDDDPLVFYHYSSTRILPDGSVHVPVLSRGGRSQRMLLENVINPYVERLKKERASLHRRFPALASAESEIRYGAPVQASATASPSAATPLT